MFHPTEYGENVMRDVQADAQRISKHIDDAVENDPRPEGALERAYLQLLRSFVEHQDRELLLNVLARPELADELHLLNRDFDRRSLCQPRGPGRLGIIIRLAIDGLFVSDLLDRDRFHPDVRALIHEALEDLTHTNPLHPNSRNADNAKERNNQRTADGRGS